MFRVLLVDDEELALISLQYSFPWKEYGFTDIITATNSEEALRILKERRVMPHLWTYVCRLSMDWSW